MISPATRKAEADTAPTSRQAAEVSARRGLFVPRHPATRYARDELVTLARSGIRGFRVTEPVRLTAEAPEAAARHLCALRDAAAVGLRTIWQGTLQGIPTAPLHHLDPPRGEDRALLWPVPLGPRLTLRHGPGYLQVEDRRGGTGVHRLLIDSPNEVRVLRDPAMSCVAEAELSRHDLAAVRSLADRGLFMRIGTVWFALPVRFRYARG
ncbi:DUF5825 family protein [Kitasatospora sp. NPDC101235]|uniref:DUF5825 family protein n=1 Tax=Kitasatospora sp. NPDC101235 TaxID=3364101 RepID=UPI0037F882AC